MHIDLDHTLQFLCWNALELGLHLISFDNYNDGYQSGGESGTPKMSARGKVFSCQRKTSLSRIRSCQVAGYHCSRYILSNPSLEETRESGLRRSRAGLQRPGLPGD